jgi:hypothetical protein
MQKHKLDIGGKMAILVSSLYGCGCAARIVIRISFAWIVKPMFYALREPKRAA